jgi:hypothetical protein
MTTKTQLYQKNSFREKFKHEIQYWADRALWQPDELFWTGELFECVILKGYAGTEKPRLSVH